MLFRLFGTVLSDCVAPVDEIRRSMVVVKTYKLRSVEDIFNHWSEKAVVYSLDISGQVWRHAWQKDESLNDARPVKNTTLVFRLNETDLNI